MPESIQYMAYAYTDKQCRHEVTSALYADRKAAARALLAAYPNLMGAWTTRFNALGENTGMSLEHFTRHALQN